MKSRESLKRLLEIQENINSLVISTVQRYSEECEEEDKNYLFIADHAISRYLTRILGYKTDETDDERIVFSYCSNMNISPEQLRDDLFSRTKQRKLLFKYSPVKLDGVVYIIKNLTVITVYKDESCLK